MNLPSRSRVRSPGGLPSPLPAGADHQHVVEFYGSEEFLVGTVAGFVGPALNDGDAAIVVATATHHRAFEGALRASGVDLSSAVASDRYLALDAAELLQTFMMGGAPDPGRFSETVGGVIERAAAGGRRVRIYGEMVALLWDAGDVTSAIALEDLWNDLAAERDFMLLCAYAMSSFVDTASVEAFKRICDQHSTVIPSKDYAMLGGADAQQRVVAQLQQQTAALTAEVARLRADEIIAELDYVEAPAARARPLEVGARRSRPTPLSAASHATASVPASSRRGSPGGRLLVESLGTLSSRIRYAD